MCLTFCRVSVFKYKDGQNRRCKRLRSTTRLARISITHFRAHTPVPCTIIAIRSISSYRYTSIIIIIIIISHTRMILCGPLVFCFFFVSFVCLLLFFYHFKRPNSVDGKRVIFKWYYYIHWGPVVIAHTHT